MEYTCAQLTAQIESMRTLFDEVMLIDPAAARQLDPATLEPGEEVVAPPPLDEAGRAWRPLHGPDGNALALYWGVRVNGRPCVLMGAYRMAPNAPQASREANALCRLLNQYQQELSHDYVTGVYNRAFLDAEFRARVTSAAHSGQPVSVALVRVNEYARICRTESVAAADRCLTTAAGILGLAVDLEQGETPLIRLEDGVFLVVSVGTDARTLEHRLRETLDSARKNFAITLARRGEFTTTVAAADWAETGSWEWMLSLAEQRLGM